MMDEGVPTRLETTIAIETYKKAISDRSQFA